MTLTEKARQFQFAMAQQGCEITLAEAKRDFTQIRHLNRLAKKASMKKVWRCEETLRAQGVDNVDELMNVLMIAKEV
jgi:hypothetical protein